MSCTSPLTVASMILPRVGALGLLHERFEIGDRGLHRLGALQHLGDDELVVVEEPADFVHPSISGPLMISSGAASLSLRSRSSIQAVFACPR